MERREASTYNATTRFGHKRFPPRSSFRPSFASNPLCLRKTFLPVRPGISPREILFNRNSQRRLSRSRASLPLFSRTVNNRSTPRWIGAVSLKSSPFTHKNLCKAVDSSIASINRLPSPPSSPRRASFSIHGKYSPIFHTSPSFFFLIFLPFFLLFARIFISTYFCRSIDRSIEHRIHQLNRFIPFIRASKKVIPYFLTPFPFSLPLITKTLEYSLF